MTDASIFILLSSVSFAAWFVSMLVGGGSPLILIPLVTLLLGAQSVAPVLTIGSVLGNAQRGMLLWKHIDWSLTLWQVPGVVTGSLLGAYAFTQIETEGLQLFIAIALLYLVLHSFLSDRLNLPSFNFQAWHFLPLGFLNAVASGLIGSTGPILNPRVSELRIRKREYGRHSCGESNADAYCQNFGLCSARRSFARVSRLRSSRWLSSATR